MTALVTGAAGFIGSSLVRRLRREGVEVVSLDALAYAGSVANLADLADDPGHTFIEGNVANTALVRALVADHGVDRIVHLAALTHVDRSIDDPLPFTTNNVVGTALLLEALRGLDDIVRFVHVSTDEVFGDLGEGGFFDESSPYRPSSPYAASKAASDHLVRSWGRTYDMPVVVANLTNVYGPRQHPEKLVPLAIRRLLAGEPVPVYGDGLQERDWMHVSDAADALALLIDGALTHSSYVVGPGSPVTNRSLLTRLVETMGGSAKAGLRAVADRPGHDRRYAADASRLRGDLGWEPQVGLDQGLAATVDWYRENPDWVREMLERSGDFESRWYDER